MTHSPKKQVLIFTVATGQGHNQAAKSLKELFPQDVYQVEIMDPVMETNRFLRKFITDGYLFVAAKAPGLYGRLYRLADREGVNPSVKTFFVKSLRRILGEAISRSKADLVISTHPLLNEPLSSLKKEGWFPLAAFVTDYRAHRSYMAPQVDVYFTASGTTAKSLIAQGAPANRVFGYGIPVSQAFHSGITGLKNSKRQGRLQLLVMGGSMGIGFSRDFVETLLQLHPSIHLHVVCGNNQSLYRNLANFLGEEKDAPSEVRLDERLQIYGYTDQIPRLMEECDLLISKPGGITVTEAILKNKPLLIPFCIPGQEEENAAFLTSKGMAVTLNSLEHLEQVLQELLEHPEKLELMKQNIARQAEEYSMTKTLEILESLVVYPTEKIS